MKLDIHYKIGITIIALGVAYVGGHAIYLHNNKPKTEPAPTPEATKAEERKSYSLTPAQRVRLVESLGEKPKGVISLASLAGDVEAYSFGVELQGAFMAADWQVPRHDSAMVVPPVYGVLVTVGGEPTPLEDAVIKSLEQAKVPVTVRKGEKLNPGQPVSVFVGRQP